MKIRWIGHASFHIETAAGVRIRTDPYDYAIGLPISQLPADIITVSHEHFDHNAVDTVPGNPTIIRGSERDSGYSVKGIELEGIPTFHDEAKGSKRGANTVFVITADGLRLAHLGDLGHTLSKEQLARLGKVDILILPVGGTYTIDAAAATTLMEAIGPSITIPMHYKIPGLTVNVRTVDAFLAGKTDVKRQDEITVTRESLPAKPTVVLLSPKP